MANGTVQEFIKDPRKALFKLTLPILGTMFVQVLYNIVDTAFVGRLGSEAIAAITYSFPVFFFMISLNAGIGIGMGSRISRSLGAGQKFRANNTATHGILLSIFIAILVSSVGTIFIGPLLDLFGATGDVRPMAMEYLSVILFASFFIFSSGIFNQIFNAQGDTKTPMKIVVTALIINIILDPVYIYVLGLGVKGAAYATLSAFGMALIIFTITFLKKSQVQFIIRGFSLKFETIKEILSVGIPASLTMIIISVYLSFINKFMAHFGTDYVAAFGIVARLESMAVMPMASISLAMVTLTGMFYGAKQFKILDDTVWYSLKISVLMSLVVAVVFFAVPGLFFRIFTNDAGLIQLGVDYMRINVFTFPFMAVTITMSRVMQGLGYGLPGMFVNLTRVLILAVPLSFVFIFIFNLPYLSVPVAGVIGGGVASLVGVVWYRSLLKKCQG